MSQIALEKRLNEIRRLEGINRDLLVALREIANGPWAIDSMREIAGHAIDKAEERP